MAESKYALTNAGESGNTADALPTNLGKSLQDLNLTLSLASVNIRLLTRFGNVWLYCLRINYM